MKRRMKKITAILLSAMMVFSITGCGKKVAGTTETSELPSVLAEAGEKAMEMVEEAEETAAEAVEEVEDIADSIVADLEAGEEAMDESTISEYSVGSIEGQTYTNETFNMTVTFGDEWTFATAEELAQIGGMTSEKMTDEKIKEAIENAGQVTEFYAMADQGLRTVNITAANAGVLYGTLLDEESYLEKAMEYSDLAAALEAVGLANVELTTGVSMVCGEEHPAMFVTAELPTENGSIPVYEVVVVVKAGTYFANVTVCSYVEDTTTDMLGLFQPIH